MWQKVELKTRFRSLEEAKSECRDIERLTMLGWSFSKKVAGTVDENYRFKLVVLRKNYSGLSFDGEFKRIDGNIIMSGEVRPRIFYERKFMALYAALFLYLLILLSQNTTVIDSAPSVLFRNGIIVVTIALISIAGNYIRAKYFYKKFVNIIQNKVIN